MKKNIIFLFFYVVVVPITIFIVGALTIDKTRIAVKIIERIENVAHVSIKYSQVEENMLDLRFSNVEVSYRGIKIAKIDKAEINIGILTMSSSLENLVLDKKIELSVPQILKKLEKTILLTYSVYKNEMTVSMGDKNIVVDIENKKVLASPEEYRSILRMVGLKQ